MTKKTIKTTDIKSETKQVETIQSYFLNLCKNKGYEIKNYKNQPEYAIKSNGSVQVVFVPLTNGSLKLCTKYAINHSKVQCELKKTYPSNFQYKSYLYNKTDDFDDLKKVIDKVVGDFTPVKK